MYISSLCFQAFARESATMSMASTVEPQLEENLRTKRCKKNYYLRTLSDMILTKHRRKSFGDNNLGVFIYFIWLIIIITFTEEAPITLRGFQGGPH